jgi:SAM-dependent methyltransferase
MAQQGFIQDDAYAGNFGKYRALLNRVLDHDPAMFELAHDAKIVDVGCGFGDLLKLLKDRGYSGLTGVEPDAECREGAAKRGLDVREGTLAATGLPTGFADVAIVNAVFHHVDDYLSAVEELSRILRSGGVLCFLEPAATPLRTAMDFLTFKTPLPSLVPQVKTRYEVMILEMETGLYPLFLNSQKQFEAALDGKFEKIWLRRGWFFQFGKYKRRP